MTSVLYMVDGLSSSLFGNYLKGDSDLHFLVQLHHGLILANFLHSTLDADELAVDLMTLFGKCVGNLDRSDRTKDCAGRAHLGADSESHAFQCLGHCLGIGLDLGQLVSTLALVLGKHFQCRLAGDDSFALGNEVIAAVTVLHFYNIILVSKLVISSFNIIFIIYFSFLV